MSEELPARTGPARTSAADAEFADFYRAHFKPLTAFVLMHGATLAEAADIVQDAMIEAYRTWDRIDHPRAWAYRVTSRSFGRRRFAEDLVAEPPEPAPPLCGTDIENWEQRHDLLVVLGELPLRQRQVMAWALSEFRPAEIAGELGITPEAVRSSLVKARRALSARGAR
ncbi:sigma-70 family RNA polymerase sigma factor [Lentzea sp. BCCO 10_0798]|jgi:RNA polymerase sigma factor (sigma-70 family)|uniref:Sigma-70 family RNA polymerase sigma factor n=1 Tax=Lentzea kristufekii TaxID=3095430 RepID=A0ABU4U0J2_9PSEU|nr:sigma-70 family RNA polymerase sigma factor [Lentzea sp. BCCO 10_0798]MDX8054083.1 sigma-70 family RNA polymerase sigma factor [Lentzea sp. BCCO 10_0798]